MWTDLLIFLQGWRSSPTIPVDPVAAIPAVAIEPGTFKYVIIHAGEIDDGGYSKRLVRSGPGDYHKDVASEILAELARGGIPARIPGGGRITRDDEKKTVIIYGFSYGFGGGQNEAAADVVREAMPEYFVTSSDEGY